jgi:hypothetical protein
MPAARSPGQHTCPPHPRGSGRAKAYAERGRPGHDDYDVEDHGYWKPGQLLAAGYLFPMMAEAPLSAPAVRERQSHWNRHLP